MPLSLSTSRTPHSLSKKAMTKPKNRPEETPKPSEEGPISEQSFFCWPDLRSLLGLCCRTCNSQQLFHVSDFPLSPITGTFFGHKNDKVSFCFQQNPSVFPPFLVIDLPMLTSKLADEMQYGLVRLTLECVNCSENFPQNSENLHVFEGESFVTYFNGRKVGFSMKRQMNADQVTTFMTIGNMTAGAGVFPENLGLDGKTKSDEGEFMYLRASFRRVVGSVNSESFHMIDPAGSTGQELSIFFVRFDS
ncbi:hypothetical protein AMTRI_Chr13g125300 [Amborella trichopoda]